jgi:PadR family transcriptional regulator PadR
VAEQHKRPGNTPVEQQERNPDEVKATRHTRLAISGPGAADFLTAGGGMDRPESGTKGMAQTRDEGPLADRGRLAPRPGPDTEESPGERRPDEQVTGSQTGTIGGGGAEAHNPSPERATGEDDETTGSGPAPATRSRRAGCAGTPRPGLRLRPHTRSDTVWPTNRSGMAKTDVWQGTLALMILKTLETMGPQHGYGVARRIEQTSGDLLSVNYGTLYPALVKLEQEGYITSAWGVSENNRKAKFYRLTRAGRKQVGKEARAWDQATAILARFLSPGEESS